MLLKMNTPFIDTKHNSTDFCQYSSQYEHVSYGECKTDEPTVCLTVNHTDDKAQILMVLTSYTNQPSVTCETWAWKWSSCCSCLAPSNYHLPLCLCSLTMHELRWVRRKERPLSDPVSRKCCSTRRSENCYLFYLLCTALQIETSDKPTGHPLIRSLQAEN